MRPEPFYMLVPVSAFSLIGLTFVTYVSIINPMAGSGQGVPLIFPTFVGDIKKKRRFVPTVGTEIVA